jgi:hypothetical protein
MNCQSELEMFVRLRRWWARRAFQSKAVLETGLYLQKLFTSENLPESLESVRRIKNDRKEKEFRKDVIQLVLKIVKSDNPLREMRKALISNIRSNLQHHLLFSEEICSRRHLIYEHMNRDQQDPELLWCDRMAASIALWTDVESLCLRHLQATMFEPTSDDDWWTAYVKLFEQNVLNLYRSIFAQANGDDFSSYALLLQEGDRILREFEANITREALEP